MKTISQAILEVLAQHAEQRARAQAVMVAQLDGVGDGFRSIPPSRSWHGISEQAIAYGVRTQASAIKLENLRLGRGQQEAALVPPLLFRQRAGLTVEQQNHSHLCQEIEQVATQADRLVRLSVRRNTF